MYVISFNPHKNTNSLLSPFLDRKRLKLREVSNLSKVTQVGFELEEQDLQSRPVRRQGLKMLRNTHYKVLPLCSLANSHYGDSWISTRNPDSQSSTDLVTYTFPYKYALGPLPASGLTNKRQDAQLNFNCK